MLPWPKDLHGINQGIILTVVRAGTDDFIFKDFTFGSYTHSTSEPSALFAQGDCSWEENFYIFLAETG
ncbi:hypothetical protein HMPREF9225_0136 [Peptoniphilus duerdenii ATCC BAA-1640]|uniref:Uncharacterized protein n=1 Tax=Peptoniphilus duerdenii ATCC BAA-1640 TaxID=862517 RepID=E0NIZ7_9FIRM|nr:hypothetical protein HMPREF9225_0136 [Peptoniphilus duerdenii ATCC BAA-1640]